MELLEFTPAACGQGPRQFVGEKKQYKDKEEFLDKAWQEFYLHETYEKPSVDIIGEGHARAFDNYNEEGSPSEIEEGYTFCDQKEEGAFEIYLFDEEDLQELNHTSTN